jgi:hypothetical protein
MIPFLPLLLKHRRLIAYGLAVAALIGGLLWYRASLIADGRRQGEAKVTAMWRADTAARQAATDKAVAEARAAEEAAKANNTEVMRDANEKLVAIAADRDSLDGLLRAAEDRVRRLAAAQATGQRGIDVATGIAARAAEIDRLRDEYDKACRRDAVRFEGLQREVAKQL